MNGRLEHERQSEQKLQKRLESMPEYVQNFRYSLSGLEYRTVEDYVNHIIRYLNWIKVKFNIDISIPQNLNGQQESHAGAYLNYLKTGEAKDRPISSSYRMNAWTAMNHFYKYMVRLKYVEYNPMENQKREAPGKDFVVKDALTAEEIQFMFQEIEKTPNNALRSRNLLLLSLMLDTAARITGILEINLTDINIKEKTVIITSKGNKGALHHLSDVTMKCMEDWLKNRNNFVSDPSNSALFLSTRGKRLSYTMAWKMFKNYSQNIEKNISPHTTRRSIATMLYNQTHDVELVKDKLMHASVTTTSRYLKKNDEHIKRANQIGDDLLRNCFRSN